MMWAHSIKNSVVQYPVKMTKIQDDVSEINKLIQGKSFTSTSKMRYAFNKQQKKKIAPFKHFLFKMIHLCNH